LDFFDLRATNSDPIQTLKAAVSDDDDDDGWWEEQQEQQEKSCFRRW
jgi:hypothetical protein